MRNEARVIQLDEWAARTNAETRRVMGVSVAPEIPERQEARAYLSRLMSDQEAAARVAADLERVRSLGGRPRDECEGLSWSFAAACRAAVEKHRERAEVSKPPPGRAAYWTVEALVFALRDGLDALKHPSNQRRLGELNDKQIKEVAARGQRFMPHIAPAWKSADVETLVSIWSKLR